MKRILFCALCAVIIFSGCKEQTVGTADIAQLNNHVTTCQYAPYTTGSTFDYEQETNFGTTNVTWTVGNDKVINGKQFIEVSGFLGLSNSGYFNCENGEYTILIENVPSVVGTYEVIYMKENAAVNATWSKTIDQSYSGIDYQTEYHFTFVGMETSRTVKGTTYQNIIHIHLDTYSDVNGFNQLVSQDDYYWAEGVGLILATGTKANFKLLSYNIN